MSPKFIRILGNHRVGFLIIFLVCLTSGERPSKNKMLKMQEFLSFFKLWTTNSVKTWPTLLPSSPSTYLFLSNLNLNYSQKEDEDHLYHLLEEKGENTVITGLVSRDVLQTKTHLLHSLNVILIITAATTTDQLQKVSQFTCKKRDEFLFISASEPTLQKTLYPTKVIIGLRHKMAYALDSQTIYFDPPTYNQGIPQIIPLSQVNNLLFQRSAMAFNLRGRHFKMAGCVDSPPHHFIRKRSPTLEQDGTEYRVFVAASLAFNFTFETHYDEGTGYGTHLENGTWTGMISNLIYTDRNFDFTVTFCHLYELYDRFDYLSRPTNYLSLTFVQGLPKNEIVTWDAVFSPFYPSVWFCILVTYLLICIIILVIKLLKENDWLQSTYSSFLIPFKISLDQSVYLAPSGNIRKIAIPWLILTLITGSAYRTVLISFLTCPSFASVPQTFVELAKRLDYKIMLYVLGSVETHFFQENENPTISTINSRLKLIPFEDGKTCYFRAAYGDKTVCLAWFPSTSRKMQAMGIVNTDNLEKEVFQVSKDKGMYVTLSVPFQKNSIFVDSFAPIIGALLDTGIHSMWDQDVGMWFKLNGLRKARKKQQKINLQKSLESEPKPLQKKNLLVVFLILFVGLLASFGIFCGEMVKVDAGAFTMKNSFFEASNRCRLNRSVIQERKKQAEKDKTHIYLSFGKMIMVGKCETNEL